jgi:hypothetical protein
MAFMKTASYYPFFKKKKVILTAKKYHEAVARFLDFLDYPLFYS